MDKKFKIDYQLFALNTTTSTGMSPEMKEYYDKKLLERMLPNLRFVKYGQKKPIPKGNGKTIEFRKFHSLPLALTPLTEGVPPELQDITVTAINATVKQHGAGVAITDVLNLTAYDPVLAETTEVLGEQAGETLDVITRDILAQGTSVYHVGGGIDVDDITTSDVLTSNDMLKLWTIFKRNKIKPFQGGDYFLFCSPEQAADIMRDPLWQDVSKYNGGKKIEDGEIGRMRGFRFIDTTLIEPIENASDVPVYSGFALGKDAYGIVDIENGSKPSVIVKNADGDTSDKTDFLNQKSTVGWKSLFTAIRLNELAIIRVHSTATI